jgi:hypothetical protein
LAPDSTTSTTGTGEIFANSNSITIGNPIQYVSGTNNLSLEVGGSTNLTLAGPFTLYGNDHSVMTNYPARTLQVTNTGLTTITGVISDGGSNYGFNLTGSGITLFNNTETYGGATTNSGGTLLVNGQVGPGIVVVTNATLGGIGKITGPVTLQSGGVLTAGSQSVAGNQGIGTLTFSSSLTMQGGSTNFIEVSKTGGLHDLFTGISTVTFAGTLNATNIAGTSVIGDSYPIYSATTYAGTFTNIIGSPGPGLGWSFNTNSGVLSVVAAAPPIFTVPPHISAFSITTGTNLAVTVTNAQAGDIYYLVSTTNLLTPAAQWIPVGTNTAANANTYTFNITNAVNPKDTQQFFRFSSTNN